MSRARFVRPSIFCRLVTFSSPRRCGLGLSAHLPLETPLLKAAPPRQSGSGTPSEWSPERVLSASAKEKVRKGAVKTSVRQPRKAQNRFASWLQAGFTLQNCWKLVRIGVEPVLKIKLRISAEGLAGKSDQEALDRFAPGSESAL